MVLNDTVFPEQTQFQYTTSPTDPTEHVLPEGSENSFS